jgi:hypothetical protein
MEPTQKIFIIVYGLRQIVKILILMHRVGKLLDSIGGMCLEEMNSGN